MEMDGTVKNKLITLQGLQYVYNAIREQKTDKHLLYFETNPNRIIENGATLTYNKIYQMLMDSPSFVVLVRDNSAYHPNVITGEQIVFISSHVSNGYETMERVSISNENLVTVTNGKAQMCANKTGTINSTNKSDTEKYPSIKAVVDYVGTVAQDAANEAVIKNKELLRGPIGPRGQNGTLVYYNGLSDEEKAQIDLDQVASSQVEIAKIKQNLQGATDNFMKNSKTVISTIDINDGADMDVKALRVYGHSCQSKTPTPDEPSEIFNIQNNVIWSTRQDGNIFNPSSFGHFKYRRSDGNVLENYGMIIKLNRDAHVGLYDENGLTSLNSDIFLNRYELNVTTMQVGGPVDIAKKDEILQPIQLKKDVWYIISTTTKDNNTLNYIKNGIVICYDDVGMPDKYIAPDTISTIDLSGTAEKPLILRSVPDGNGGQIADWVDLTDGVVHRLVKQDSFASHAAYGSGRAQFTLTSTAATTGDGRQSKFACNMGVYASGGTTKGTGFISSSGDRIFLYCDGNEYSESNQLVVAYALATEYTEPLYDYGIDAQTLHMNYQNTTVINDRENAFHIEYVVNTKEYFDKIHKALIHKTASGEGMISVDDSAEVDAESVRVYGRSWQSGTPTPDAPVPIVSVTDDAIRAYRSNNLLDTSSYASVAIDDAGTKRNGFYVDLPKGDYSLSGSTSPGLWLRTAINGVYTQIRTNTFASGTLVINMPSAGRLIFSTSSNQVPETNSALMLNIGRTALPFEQYDATVIPIVGTAKSLILRSVPDGNGGQIADWIDLNESVVHRRVHEVSYTSVSLTSGTTTGQHYVMLPRKAKTDNVAPRQGRFLCNMGVHSETSNNVGMAYILTNGTQFRIFLDENVVSDSNQLTVVYAIADEYTEPLSDYGIDVQTLRMNYPETTIISGNGVGLEVQYLVDTKTYVDAHSGGAAQQDPSYWNFTTEQQDIARKKIGIQILTQEQYDLISVKDQNTMYVITG